MAEEGSKKPIDPEAQLERDLFNHVKALTNKSIRDREIDKFDEKIDRNYNRFRAMRSIRGLDYKDLPKTYPWPGCSDIGIPIDAITIQAIVARCDRVEFERLPLTHVTAVGQADLKTAPKIEAYLDWQKLNKMKIRIPKMMATRSALTVGSHFMKMIYEEYGVYDDQEVMALRDPDGGALLKDDDGELVELNPDEPTPTNDSGHEYQLVLLNQPKKKLYYRGPVAHSRNPKQILWDKSETSYDPEDWDWWADLYERSVEWLENEGVEIGFKNIDKIVAQLGAKVSEAGQTRIDKKKLIKLREWYGQYLIKGKMRDIVAVVAVEYDTIIGWRFDDFMQKTGMRRLIHRCPIPMEGQVLGMPIPEFIKGLRDTIDIIVNQMNDRGSRYNNPPIIYQYGSGFDPNKHNWGYRFWAEKVVNSIRELPMQRGETNEFAKLELLLSLIQRLFGVTDSTAGIENPNNQTATGIVTLLSEGNVNIDMIITALNESNITLDHIIIAMNALYMETDQEGNPLPQDFPIIDHYSSVMEDPDNPFAQITQEELLGKYNYMPSGATLSNNTRTIREEAAVLYKQTMESVQINPFAADLSVLREVTADYYKSFGKNNIKIRTVEEMQKHQNEQAAIVQAEAIIKARQMEMEGIAKDVGKAEK